jgi:thiamine pyrophosphokinase
VRIVIFSAGEVSDYEPIRALVGAPDQVLCADGGIRHALALGLTPDLLLGDFDSAGPAVVEEMAARGIPVQRVPVEKDETDTHLALAEAVRRGASEILLVGATGSRLDHTLSNLLLLPGVPNQVDLIVADGHNLVRLVRPGGRLTVPALPDTYLSLLPLTPEVKGVVLEGVKWPLDGVTLRWGESVGVSNRIVGEEAFLAIRDGYLLVIQARD